MQNRIVTSAQLWDFLRFQANSDFYSDLFNALTFRMLLLFSFSRSEFNTIKFVQVSYVMHLRFLRKSGRRCPMKTYNIRCRYTCVKTGLVYYEIHVRINLIMHGLSSSTLHQNVNHPCDGEIPCMDESARELFKGVACVGFNTNVINLLRHSCHRVMTYKDALNSSGRNMPFLPSEFSAVQSLKRVTQLYKSCM